MKGMVKVKVKLTCVSFVAEVIMALNPTSTVLTVGQKCIKNRLYVVTAVVCDLIISQLLGETFC